MSLGKSIKLLIEQNHITQKELAIRSHCTEDSISRYIRDERRPNYKTLNRIAVDLGVSVDALIRGKIKDDFVKVVRCKECKHWGGITFGQTCRRWSGIELKHFTRPNDYCSYGERKDDINNA